MGKELIAKLTDGQVDVREYFLQAFSKLYEDNKREDIKPEQYAKNIEVMLQIAKEFI